MTKILTKADAFFKGATMKVLQLNRAFERRASFNFVAGCDCCEKFLEGVRKGMLHNPAEWRNSYPYRMALRSLPRQFHKTLEAQVGWMMEHKAQVWDENPLAMKFVGIMAKGMEKKLLETHCPEDRKLHEVPKP